MQWQLSPSVIAEAGTALAILIVSVYFPWRDLNRRANLIGSVLLTIAALWILTHSLEIGTPLASYKAYLMGIQLIWGLIAMALWLMYITQYSAYGKWQTRRFYALFGIMPLLAVLALATNQVHGLLWTAPGLNANNPYLPLDPAYGLFYWVCMVYIGVMVACGSFLILKKVIRRHNYRNWEPWALLLAAVIPLLTAFLEVMGLTQPAGLTIGITPFFSSIGAIILVWSLPRFHLQQVIPVARDTVFERISDCVVVLDMQNRVVDLNPAAEHLAGFSSSEALGLPVEQIWPTWPSQLVPSESASTVFEELVLAQSGEPRTYTLYIYAITDHNNTPLNQVALLLDITERRHSESENRRLREKAEISSRLAAVGEMAAGIAHEINNPLTGVIGFSELLTERQDLSADIRDQLRIIAEGSNRVKDIVKRMLTFARQTKPVRRNVNINELIEATLSLRSYVLKTANIEIIQQFDLNLPMVNADPGQMQQVFLNLIVNAEYAMKQAHGRGTLVITTEKMDDHIRISFKDDGAGMSQDTKDKLFHPFFTTKDVGEGTGLGLGLSRSIILEHSGTIEVESQPGEGATFIISLPLTLLEEETSFKEVAGIESSNPKARPAKFLVVDDEETIRLLVTTILSQRGYSVDATGDASDAIAKLDSSAYDAILMDIRMPGMNGMELYARITAQHPELAAKVIFITGDTSDATTKAFLNGNHLPCITKPFDRETLLGKMNGLLGGKINAA